jgi:hypothetical protein
MSASCRRGVPTRQSGGVSVASDVKSTTVRVPISDSEDDEK